MLSEEEQNELASLRERVYGSSGGEGVDEALLGHLALLETRWRSVTSVNDFEAASDGGDVDIRTSPASRESDVRSRPRWQFMVLGVAVVALNVMAFVGGSLAVHLQLPASQSNGIPELGWVQTEEDVTPDVGLSDTPSSLEPSSIRFVGTVQRVKLYIGHQTGSENICVAAHPPDVQQWSVTCSTIGVTAQVGQDFLVAVGPADPAFLEEYGSGLNPNQISESVTVYLRG